MRRWNGWGDESVDHPVPERARRFLEAHLGEGIRPQDAALADVVHRVPRSRLPQHPLVTDSPEQRVRHALGQSVPDWITARSGDISAYPDGVAFPATSDEVRDILRFATRTGAHVIPYGGGTSVVGHLTVPSGDGPVLSVDMERCSRLVRLDESSGLATFEAGARGPVTEAFLRARGFTLGHFPQSFEYSTLGGWIATRSVGQFSLRYGRIENLFAGGRLEAPAGTFTLPPVPASAAGPDLRHVILGSEGRLGILTEATVRVSRLPETEAVVGAFFPNMVAGLDALREMTQTALPLAMLRLSSPEETATTLLLAGRERLVGLLERWLALRGVGEGKCLLLLGAAGRKPLVNSAIREALAVARAHRGVYAGAALGRAWLRHRFRTPYLRNSLWDLGYAVDTVETAAPWNRIPPLIAAVEQALRRALEDIGERVIVFTHLSHPYRDGSNLYTTVIFRLSEDPKESLRRWQVLKTAVSRAIVAGGGTISHQHGVGIDHRAYLEAESGPLGKQMIRSLCGVLDPDGIMNPGKLV